MFGNWPKLTLGFVSGIPVRLDFTFIIVPLLFLNRMTAQTGSDAWLEIATVIVGIFLSVLLHELGHALTARTFGIGVGEVVVGGFYGYARLLPHRTTRRITVGILAAGPFANLVLFLVFWGMLEFPSLGQLRIIAFFGHPGLEMPLWMTKAAGLLAFVNLAMFLFNLLPAFPLDGGRIVDQVLSRFLQPKPGIRISSVLGIVIGAAVAYFGYGFSLFLALIGVFIVVINLGRLRGGRPPQAPRRPSVQRK